MAAEAVRRYIIPLNQRFEVGAHIAGFSNSAEPQAGAVTFNLVAAHLVRVNVSRIQTLRCKYVFYSISLMTLTHLELAITLLTERLEMPKFLPPEIWDFIIDLLSRPDQRSCLLLSRAHRDVVFPKLFSQVTAFLGLRAWRPWTPIEEPIGTSDDDHNSRMIRVNSITQEILNTIPCRTDLAQVVRDFTVRAYVWGKNTNDERESSAVLIFFQLLSPVLTKVSISQIR